MKSLIQTTIKTAVNFNTIAMSNYIGFMPKNYKNESDAIGTTVAEKDTLSFLK